MPQEGYQETTLLIANLQSEHVWTVVLLIGPQVTEGFHLKLHPDILEPL